MIKIIEEPEIKLTRSEYNRLFEEYKQIMSYYAGPKVSFDEWVTAKNSNQEVKILLKG
jgi:hypothetical protein